MLAAGNIYIPDEAGLMHVFRASGEFEAIAQNDLADGGFASPVVIGGVIYLRTLHHLYAIAAGG